MYASDATFIRADFYGSKTFFLKKKCIIFQAKKYMNTCEHTFSIFNKYQSYLYREKKNRQGTGADST